MISFIFYIIWKCRKRYLSKLRKLSRKKWKNEHCNTLRGNFVLIYDTPIEEKYIIDNDSVLGRGSFGVVVLGRHKETGNEYAIKFMHKTNEETKRLEREVKLLKDVDHTNIVSLFAVYETSEQVGFVMELCSGGHLGKLVEHRAGPLVSEERAKALIRQLLSAITHMHARGICHRDIKLQNILLENDQPNAQIKLIDFGFGTRFIGATPLRTRCGTPYTTAPEVFRECYDERCDVWSAGVVAYIVICGRRPFEALHIPGELEEAGKAAMITNILLCRYHFNHPHWKKVSPEAIDFVQKMMHPDYKTRWHAMNALEHDWFDPSATLYVETQRTGASNLEGIDRILSNMRRTSFMSSLHKTSMLAVVFSQPNSRTDGLRTLFQNFDTDHNGTLSKEEFVDAMQYMSQETLSPEDADTLFQAIDVNNDRQISFTEFLAATLDPREVDVNELNKAFELLDIDKKGHITVSDLQRVLDAKHHHSRSARRLSGLSKDEGQEKEGVLLRGPSGMLNRMSSLGFLKSVRSIGIREASQSNASVDSDFSQSQDMYKNKRERKMKKMSELAQEDDDDDDRRKERKVETVQDIMDPVLAARIQDIFNTCDMNGDGVISYSEFLWAMADGDGLFHPGGIMNNASVAADDSDDSANGDTPAPQLRRGLSMPIIRQDEETGQKTALNGKQKLSQAPPPSTSGSVEKTVQQQRRNTSHIIGDHNRPATSGLSNGHNGPNLLSSTIIASNTSTDAALPFGNPEATALMRKRSFSKRDDEFDVGSSNLSMRNNLSTSSLGTQSSVSVIGLPSSISVQSALSRFSDDDSQKGEFGDDSPKEKKFMFDLSSPILHGRPPKLEKYECSSDGSVGNDGYCDEISSLERQISKKGNDSDLSCQTIADMV